MGSGGAMCGITCQPLLVGRDTRRSGSESSTSERSTRPSPLQRIPVHLPREYERLFPCSHLADQLPDPRPLVRVSHAMCPPPVHAAPDRARIELVLFALLTENVQQEAGVQPLETELRQTFEDSRDSEIVVSGS